VPVEVRTRDCAAVELTATFPKARDAALRLNEATLPAEPSCNAKICETPPRLAVIVAACALSTALTLAVNVALVAPAATAAEAGTVTAVLLLARFTVNPLLSAAAFSVSVQLSVPAPVIALLLQLSELSTGTPVPLRPTTVEDPAVESVVIVNWPVVAPVDVGANWTETLKLEFAAIVTGNPLWPLAVNDCPATAICETFTDPEP